MEEGGRRKEEEEEDEEGARRKRLKPRSRHVYTLIHNINVQIISCPHTK